MPTRLTPPHYFVLCSYVDEFDIDTQDHNIHKHIPFAVLLIKIAEDWKNAHGGKLPANVRLFKVMFNNTLSELVCYIRQRFHTFRGWRRTMYPYRDRSYSVNPVEFSFCQSLCFLRVALFSWPEIQEAITTRRRVEEDEDNYTEALKSAYIMLFPPGISELLNSRFI